MCNFIEDHGYETVPIMYYGKNLAPNTGEAKQRPDGSLKPQPEVFFNFRTGAVLCGVGEIGHSRVLLSPEFGPAQRLYFIVTEAELETDPIINGICDHCMECVKDCPANALQYMAEDNIDIPGITKINRSAIDILKCRLAHISGGLSPYANEKVRRYVKNIVDGTEQQTADGSPRPSIEDMEKFVTENVSYAANIQKIFGCLSALCGDGCIRSCLAHLDETGKLSKKFRNSFRRQ